jgi:hypothetical protein
MEVIEIVEIFLIEKGYDGLYSDDCGCMVGDLAPCGEMKSDCCAGYKHVHSVTGDYVIASLKNPMSDAEIQDVIDAT